MHLEGLKEKVKLLDYVQKNGGQIEKAGQNTYRLNPCPVCGHKDHFTIYPENNSYYSFSGCCEGGSIIDYMIEIEGMTQAQAIDKVKQMAGIEKEEAQIKKTNTFPVETETPQKPKLTAEEIKDTAALVEKAQNNKTDYYHSRGLTEKTIKKYKLGYLPSGHKYGGAFKYVLPVNESFIILRSNNEQDRYRNIGNTEILNLHYLQDPSLTDKQIFITEGFFDALSLEELDLPAVALNSTAMCDTLINSLRDYQEQLKEKLFVLALDEDQGGRETAKKLKEAMLELNIPFTELRLNGYKDINQYFQKDSTALLQQIKNLPLKGTTYEYLQEGFELDQLKRINEPDILTGLNRFDYTLGGGLYPGLYVLGAISSLGKTALALQLADKIAEQEQKVLFFSLEMGRYEMTCRSLARVLFEQHGNKEITTGNILKTNYKGQDLYSKTFFKEALDSYKEGPARNLTLHEGNYDLDINMLRGLVSEHINRTGERPVVFVDYLQVLRPVDLRITEKQHIDLTIVELKRISRDYDLPVIAVSSFNRANYKTDVTFEAFKESGAIEYTADVVIALQMRKNETDDINELKNREPRPLEMVLLKNRRGRAYEVIELDYWPKQNFFAEV